MEQTDKVTTVTLAAHARRGLNIISAVVQIKKKSVSYIIIEKEINDQPCQ